jgi:hypothetical protein
MVDDFCSDWAPFVPDDFGSDCAPFIPDEEPEGSVAWRSAPELPPDGALCCAAAPPESRPIPVPCALAKPALAISAMAATEVRKRLVMEYLLTCFHARADNESRCAMFPVVRGSFNFVL